jgi:phage terminase large subunit
MPIAVTTALNKIKDTLYEPTFYKVIQGGMSSSKTFSILILLVGYAESYPNSLITVAGMTYGHLSTGAIRDFTNIMKGTDRWDDLNYNKSAKLYTFPNGSQIEFLSLDNMTSRGPRRDVLFVNEANGIDYETFDQLAGRTRDFVILDYNPSARFWAHDELVDGKHKDRTSFLLLTYIDNEALSTQEKENIESRKPKEGEEPSNWWIVYGLGQIGSLEGNIYSGWQEASVEEIKKGRLLRYGLDFGFSNDESALVAIYELEGDKIGILELLYQKKILGSQYPEILMSQNIDPNVLIVADSARPEIIAEIKNKGFRIVGADKNAGSVKRGIDRVSQKQIIYNGKNLKQEYLSYAWRKKRTGEILDEPQDGLDHLMDALRYAIDDLNKKRIQF